jgi:hypothetical protein
MNNNAIILSSLAMDLKRVGLGLHRRSFPMADRFAKEVLQRVQEADIARLSPYMQIIMSKLENMLQNSDVDQKAEYSLMYSTLIQNYVVYTASNYSNK